MRPKRPTVPVQSLGLESRPGLDVPRCRAGEEGLRKRKDADRLQRRWGPPERAPTPASWRAAKRPMYTVRTGGRSARSGTSEPQDAWTSHESGTPIAP